MDDQVAVRDAAGFFGFHVDGGVAHELAMAASAAKSFRGNLEILRYYRVF